jgi:hypothetical protein
MILRLGCPGCNTLPFCGTKYGKYLQILKGAGPAIEQLIIGLCHRSKYPALVPLISIKPIGYLLIHRTFVGYRCQKASVTSGLIRLPS